jgi:pilus assembly protein CpaB
MLAIVGLLVTAYVAKNLLARTELPPEDPIVTIPMPLADLQPGTLITDGHIATGRLRNSMMTPETIRAKAIVIGRVVKVPLSAAQPILTTDLYPPGEFPPLELGPGMRAVSISVSSGGTVDGLIRTGHYVDVHFTPASYRDLDQTGGLTMTLFDGVKVLAMNRSTGSAALARSENSVTLELTEQQANIVILAQEKGDLTLTYTDEGPGDGGVGVSREDRATLEEILDLSPLPDPERPFETEIFYGGDRSVLQFDDRRRIDSSGTPAPTRRQTRGVDADASPGSPSAFLAPAATPR